MTAETGTDRALSWALSCLPSDESRQVEEVCATHYSRVVRARGAAGDFYIKQVPPKLFREAALLGWLQQFAPDAAPVLVAENAALGCFITRSAGVPIRTQLKAGGDLRVLEYALAHYAKLQMASANRIDELIALGVPDWRVSHLPALFGQLLAAEELQAEGLKEEQLSALQNSVLALHTFCEALERCGIAPALEQVDFHDNNILTGPDGPRVIDWGEAVISHPFFSMVNCLFSVARHHQMEPGAAQLMQLRRAYLQPWHEAYSAMQIEAAFAAVEQLAVAYKALTYHQLATYCGAEGRFFWQRSIIPTLKLLMLPLV